MGTAKATLKLDSKLHKTVKEVGEDIKANISGSKGFKGIGMT
jgi:hypothetical protein